MKYRRKLGKKRSKKMFRRSAGNRRVNRKNARTNQRGGIRL